MVITDDAVLVTTRERAQDVKLVSEALPRRPSIATGGTLDAEIPLENMGQTNDLTYGGFFKYKEEALNFF